MTLQKSAGDPSKSTGGPLSMAGLVLSGLGMLGIYEVNEHPEGWLGRQYYGSPLDHALYFVFGGAWATFAKLFRPVQSKALRVWPDEYEGIPPGMPPPPVCLVGFEKTLVLPQWDALHGWRHVKRPGVDRFLKEVSQHYEIYVVTDQDRGIVEPAIISLDANRGTISGVVDCRCHKLERGKHYKQLDVINRDHRRVVFVDADPESLKNCLSNSIIVPEFENAMDVRDPTLHTVTDVLLQFVAENKSQDIPATLRQLGTNSSEELGLEIERRRSEIRARRRRGLVGSVAHSRQEDDATAGAGKEEQPRRSLLPSALELVGRAPDNSMEASLVEDQPKTAALDPRKDAPGKRPTGEKRKGGILKWYERMQEAEAERARAKEEKLNELYRKKQAEKLAAEQARTA